MNKMMNEILKELKKNGTVVLRRGLRTDYKLGKLEVNAVERTDGFAEVMLFGATDDIFKPIIVDSISTKEELQKVYELIKKIIRWGTAKAVSFFYLAENSFKLF